MIACKHCLTKNSLDSTFCKHCGTAVPEDERQLALVKHEELVQAGFDMLRENRAAEAMLVAEQAVLEFPTSPGALSLKGMCHEGRGEVAEALDCYEKVVELKPDSALDKIKVNQLRNLMVAKAAEAPASQDRKGALLVAACVAVFLGFGGFALVRALGRPQQVAMQDVKPTPSVVPDTRSLGFTDDPRQRGIDNQGVSPTSAPPSANPGDLTRPSPSQNPVRTPEPATGLPTARADGTLPDPNNPGGEVRPVNPTVPNGFNPNRTPAPRTTDDPNERVIGDNPTASPTPSPSPTGIIEVRPHSGNSGGGGDLAPATGGNGLKAVLAAARSNYQLGKYAEAARGFERAIDMGGGTASNYQRLGDCYRALGRNSQAIGAYERAADLHEAAGNAAGAESCRQHIKVLKGG